jgi:hypothetical protein
MKAFEYFTSSGFDKYVVRKAITNKFFSIKGLIAKLNNHSPHKGKYLF